MSLIDSLIDLNDYLGTPAMKRIVGDLLDSNECNVEEDRVLSLYEWCAENDDCTFSELEADGNHYGMPLFNINGREYVVGTEDEAKTAHEAYLESYLDDVVTGSNGPYFDRTAWLNDNDGDRGGVLAYYDGHEREIRNFLLYRVN